MPVHHHLECEARNNPQLPCLTLNGLSRDCGEANARARGLLDLGVPRGQRMATLDENSLE